MHAELARRRAYLHLCRWTSLGLSLIEAMTIGMPVVALATTEAVAAVPPEAGALVHPRRHPASTPPAGSSTTRRPPAGRARAARAAARDRYGLDRFLADWDRLLEEEVCASR